MQIDLTHLQKFLHESVHTYTLIYRIEPCPENSLDHICLYPTIDNDFEITKRKI